jgi:hypothetical protein
VAKGQIEPGAEAARFIGGRVDLSGPGIALYGSRLYFAVIARGWRDTPSQPPLE